MKRTSFAIAATLLCALLVIGCGRVALRMENEVTPEEEGMAQIEQPAYPFLDFPPEAYPPEQTAEPTNAEGTLFNAKFEGDSVSGSGGAVGGAYHFIATQTDGESWHVKLEANYPTVAGRDYYVTYNFRSDVAGTVKFGDFQEFQIQAGENSITGVFTAKDSTSYLDLQLGMLPAFTIDFTSIEVKEYADEVTYEDALPKPVNFMRESRVYERHDQGYDTVLVRDSHAINVYYESIPTDLGVWKSRLYVRTGVVPEFGAHYRVTADVMSVNYERVIPFELLINDGNIEKGYGALYGQELVPGEVNTCEAVITGNGNGDELILQFSLGEARAGSVIVVGNVHVDKVVDQYTNALPAGYALNGSVATGQMIDQLIPVSFKNIPLSPSFYTGVDTVYEQHDDGYIVELTEHEDSATMWIKQAPANPDDRGVWKAKLYAATGVTLQPNQSYRVQFDLVSTDDQADYEVCFDGDNENDYGALYGRSLTAGGTDHVEMLITPDESHGPLTIRVQLGKTDTAAGNAITMQNLSVESVQVRYANILPSSFSYETRSNAKYESVLPDNFSYDTGTNVRETHADGYEQEAAADGSSATLNITAAPAAADGREHWKSQLVIETGVQPEAGKKYTVRFKVKADKAQQFEVCYGDASEEKRYGALFGQDLPEGEEKTVSYTFVAPEDGGSLVLKLMCGVTPDTSGNAITASDIEIVPVTTEVEADITPAGFAYPVSTESSSQTVPARYVAQPVTLSAEAVAWDGSQASASVDGATATLEVTKRHDFGDDNRIWVTRLEAGTGVTLEQGAKYHITGTLSSQDEVFYEILYSNGIGTDERGHNPGGHGYSDTISSATIPAGGSSNFEVTIDSVPGLSEYKPLFLRIQVGNGPAPNKITLSNVVVEKWVPEHDEVVSGTLTANSFDFWAHEDYNAFMGGDGSSATVTYNNVPDNAEAWKTKLFANAGVALAAGTSYRITTQVQSTQDFGYEICYNDEGTEKGVGAKYGLTASSSSEPVVFDVTPDADVTLNIQFSVGNAPMGTVATVSGIKVERLAETEGDNLMTDELVAWAPVHQFIDEGYAATLTNDDSSATMAFTAVADEQADWKAKLFVETGAKLEAGKRYRISYDIEADNSFTYHVFFNNGLEEREVGEDWNLTAGSKQTVVHEVEPSKDAVLNIQLMLGLTGAPNNVKVSNVKVEEVIGGGVPINSWAHEDYTTSLSNTKTSATIAIKKAPASGREPWKVKLFAETGAELTAGKTYRVSVDVQASKPLTYDICYNNREQEAAFGGKYGLEGSNSKQTVTYTVTPDQDGVLFLQLNLGNATSGTNVTISGVKVEEVIYTSAKNEIPSFRYDSVGYISRASDDGYITSFEQSKSSATFRIKHAPSERHAWNAKLIVHTGITPKPGKGYRITFDVDAARSQNLFEVFYDGNEELAYGALYEQYLAAGRNTFSYIVMPGNKGEIVLQLRFGETNNMSGNTYTVSNFKIEEVTFVAARTPEIKNVVENDTQDGYSAKLTKTPDRASLQLLHTPGEDQLEAWKNKLFVYSGVVLEPGQKYRISFNVRSIIPTPFEVCFNNRDVEKGLGAIFGLTALPAGHHVEYTIIADQSAQLVIQLSLGNCTAPNTIFLSDVKVEKAGKFNLVSDTIYHF